MVNLATVHRIGHRLSELNIPLLPKLFQLFIFLCYSSAISYKVKIGKGTFFNHSGFNVSIVGQGPYSHAPVLKNRIYVGPGAVIQGPVIIEDNVIIAPNAVVNKSIPKNAIVAGVPARIIGWSDKLDYDIFKNESWNNTIQPYLEDKRENK